MLLAIDVGNTNSKFVVFDGDNIVAQWRLRTEAKRTADEYAAWLTQLMHVQGFDPKSISGAILASVVPSVNQHIRRLCETYFGNGILIVGEPDCELGIKVLIDRPQEAGADRLVGVIAGHAKEATRHAERALDLATQGGERGNQVYALRLLGVIAAEQDPPDADAAHDRFGLALALAEDLGMRPLAARCHLGLGRLARLQRLLSEAYTADPQRDLSGLGFLDAACRDPDRSRICIAQGR